jgi:hypothetical protein
MEKEREERERVSDRERENKFSMVSDLSIAIPVR